MEDDRFTRITLRMPRELHARLEESAADTSKSMNAEIVARLQGSFGGSGNSDRLALALAEKVVSLELMAGSVGAFLLLSLARLSPEAEADLGDILPEMRAAAEEAHALGRSQWNVITRRVAKYLQAGGAPENWTGLDQVIDLIKESGTDSATLDLESKPRE